MTKNHGYWRSLAEYNGTAPPLDGTPEFAEPAEIPSSSERRRFLQLMGASTALATAASGCRWQEDKILPYTKRPEGSAPGEPRSFHTAMELGGAAVGLKVKSVDGRPLKVDGNRAHADSLGASTQWHQASILELYDPDRSRGYAQRVGDQLHDIEASEFRVFAKAHFRAARNTRGKGLHVIAGSTTSVAVAQAKSRFMARYPEASWHEYEAVAADNPRNASVIAFGQGFRTHTHLERAKLIVALDADPIGSGPAHLSAARGWSKGRDPSQPQMNRVYSFESSLSDTGVAAEHRFSLRREHIKALAAYLDASLDTAVGTAPGAWGASQPMPKAAFLSDEGLAKILRALVADLAAHRGTSLVVAGESQPPEVLALVHRINARLGNVGKTVTYSALEVSEAQRPSSAESLSKLSQLMNAGKVETLLVLDSNPVYTASAESQFEAGLAKVAHKISLSLYRDETTRLSDWHVPLAHYLESWGDVRGSTGVQTIVQPLIAPLYDGVTVLELLATITRSSETKGQAIVQRALDSVAKDPRLWRKALHNGVVPGTEYPVATPAIRPIVAFKYSSEQSSGLELNTKSLEIVLATDSKVYDGRFANSGWLQEVPDPVTKLTWENALLVGPKTAEALGIKDEMLVTLTVGNQTLEVPALLSPGQALGSVKLSLGYGRTAAGRIGGNLWGNHKAASVGVNAYRLRNKQLWNFSGGAVIAATTRSAKLATTQDKHTMDVMGVQGIAERLPELVRETTLHEFKKHPDFSAHVVHHPKLLSLWEEPVEYKGHKWGMAIDLNRCIGCTGCVVACQAENNIPVVGKEQIAKGREMHWLRIDRYFQGNPEHPKMVSQPIPCMHCEHAPCEQVCPVGATMHSDEGLNEMTYNRCIGTRYCSNNCPYKVRKFNYFNFHEDMKEPDNQVKGMVFNPDVTVRFRGVMEKCSYCVQRLQNGKFRAEREGRTVEDSEVATACQDACPTQAIVFGDMNDPNSQVAAAKKGPRDYSLLEELNVRPRTTYGARVRNPHPELG